MAHRVVITAMAQDALEAVADRSTRAAISRRIDRLAIAPVEQGKPLRGKLFGYLSVRAAGQRFRVLYRVDESEAQVLVYLIGIRREGSQHDIYTLAQRLVRRGFL